MKWSEVTQSCPTLCDPVEPTRLSIHGILQARILEWVAISFSRGSSWPRDQTWVSRIGGRCFNLWAIREAGGLSTYNYLEIPIIYGFDSFFLFQIENYNRGWKNKGFNKINYSWFSIYFWIPKLWREYRLICRTTIQALQNRIINFPLENKKLYRDIKYL